MGYYTDHTLDVKNVKSREEYSELCTALSEMNILEYALTEGDYSEDTQSAYFYTLESVKWYNHAEDMDKISIQFPDMTFMLEGHGEDFGDIWRDYYKNGECNSCRGEIKFEEPTTIKWSD